MVGAAGAIENGRQKRGFAAHTVFSFGAVFEECLERDAGVVLAALL